VLYFSKEENNVVIISMRKSVQGWCCSRSICSAHSAIKFSITFFVLNKGVGSLLWEVRELAMLSTAPGIDSVCFNASKLQHKCSWCSEMAVYSATQRSGLEHVLSSI
jgi:hypothetical protein